MSVVSVTNDIEIIEKSHPPFFPVRRSVPGGEEVKRGTGGKANTYPNPIRPSWRPEGNMNRCVRRARGGSGFG
ncbi:hypothetical protein TNCV_4718281 [Trichonephila clavipes]|uniref:Uncharacterized protein n=1 Tax=Trichonephila inaurata madagascariensis TaxID=2747483 RepID=A0A8X6MCS5_9ARAC|nr:hypothetical protein TNIN_63381 [Trichonephila inaurata madagascariensis]GFW59736.1 hypothetical protein TNCV_4718281 [Trichonephila clavipes]